MLHFLDALVKEIEVKANAMVNDDPYFLRIKLLGAVTNFKVSVHAQFFCEWNLIFWFF